MVKVRTLFLLVCLVALLPTVVGCPASQSGESLDSQKEEDSKVTLAEQTCKVIVTLKDEETGKPIGKVYDGYPSVILDGQDRGYVTDYGQVAIDGLSAGTHLLKMVVPTYGEVNRYVELDPGEQEDVAVQINMPNPVFDVSIESAAGGLFDEIGTIKVTLTNIGDVDARSPTAKVLVYTKDGNGNISAQPIATKTLTFGTLPPRAQGGQSQSMTWSNIVEYVWGVREVVAVAVYDTWGWTPKYANPGPWEIDLPTTIVDRLTESVVTYLENHPDVIIGTLTKLAGFDSN